MARTSTARAFSSVRSFFRFLDKRGLAHNASIAAIQTPKLPRSVPKALSEKDMADLLDTPAGPRARRLDRSARPGRARSCSMARACASARRSASPRHVVDGLLTSGRDTLAITGKGNKQRLVLLLPQAIEAMKPIATPARFMAALGPGDAFFLGARGGPLDPAIVQKRVREHPPRAGPAEA